MSTTESRTADLSNLEADIAALKRDVASMIEHLRGDLAGRAQNAADQIGASTERLYGLAAAEGDLAAKAVASCVNQQPLMCLLAALGLGFVGGRLLSR